MRTGRDDSRGESHDAVAHGAEHEDDREAEAGRSRPPRRTFACGRDHLGDGLVHRDDQKGDAVDTGDVGNLHQRQVAHLGVPEEPPRVATKGEQPQHVGRDPRRRHEERGGERAPRRDVAIRDGEGHDLNPAGERAHAEEQHEADDESLPEVLRHRPREPIVHHASERDGPDPREQEGTTQQIPSQHQQQRHQGHPRELAPRVGGKCDAVERGRSHDGEELREQAHESPARAYVARAASVNERSEPTPTPAASRRRSDRRGTSRTRSRTRTPGRTLPPTR